MERNRLVLITEGFTPKSFIDLTDEEAYDVIEDNGLIDILDNDSDALYDTWLQWQCWVYGS